MSTIHPAGRRRFSIGAVIALLVAILNVAAVTAPANAARNYYGAIAMSVADGGGGLTYDYPTQKTAENAAVKKCRANSGYPAKCRVIVWVRNGCAAVAVLRNDDSSIARYGWAWHGRKNTAIARAKAKCGKKCVTYAYTCTRRSQYSPV